MSRYPVGFLGLFLGVEIMRSTEMNIEQSAIITLILEERERQIKNFGNQMHSPLKWLAILSEEHGEVAKEVVEISVVKNTNVTDNLESELIQVAAVAVAWIEDIRKRRGSFVG